MISQLDIEDSEGQVASIYGLSKDESSVIARLQNAQLLFVPIALLQVKNAERYILTHSFSELTEMAPNTQIYPVIEETPVITKKTVETSRINIKKSIEDVPYTLEQAVRKEEFEVLRVAVGDVREEPAQMRVEGDVTYIPVQEEVLIVQKKYLIREEIQIRKRTSERIEKIEVHLKKENVEIDRKKPTN